MEHYRKKGRDGKKEGNRGRERRADREMATNNTSVSAVSRPLSVISDLTPLGHRMESFQPIIKERQCFSRDEGPVITWLMN